MLSNIFGGSFDVARQALNGLSRRQEAIAGNVANVDTPGYHRRDVVFEDALKEMITGTGGAVRLQATEPGHMALSAAHGGSAGGESTRQRDVVSERNDANDVSIDEEMLLLVETQLRYQALSQTTGTRLNTLRSIIRG